MLHKQKDLAIVQCRTKISLSSNAEAPQPVTGANTENLRSDLPRRREEGLEPPRRRREEGLEPPRRPTREEVQPVRTVRVPAHKISDREFVKIERKQRKNKEYQTDCKAS